MMLNRCQIFIFFRLKKPPIPRKYILFIWRWKQTSEEKKTDEDENEITMRCAFYQWSKVKEIETDSKGKRQISRHISSNICVCVFALFTPPTRHAVHKLHFTRHRCNDGKLIEAQPILYEKMGCCRAAATWATFKFMKWCWSQKHKHKHIVDFTCHAVCV